jgi:hypothetical protein
VFINKIVKMLQEPGDKISAAGIFHVSVPYTCPTSANKHLALIVYPRRVNFIVNVKKLKCNVLTYYFKSPCYLL